MKDQYEILLDLMDIRDQYAMDNLEVELDGEILLVVENPNVQAHLKALHELICKLDESQTVEGLYKQLLFEFKQVHLTMADDGELK